MPAEIHTFERPDGDGSLRTDRAVFGVQTNVANASGAAGATVTTAVSFAANSLPVDSSANAEYAVYVAPNQEAYAWVSGKTASGFNVNLAPISGAASIAAGKFDVIVVA